MNITWLGQSGLLLQTGHLTAIIDPYLSDSIEKTLDPDMKRKIPVDTKLFSICPDVIICTHNHLDHMDPDSLKPYLERDQRINVLSPDSAHAAIRSLGYRRHNYVLFNRWTECTFKGITFQAVKAAHSDTHPIGVIVRYKEKSYYITGDTLYNTEIFNDVCGRIDALFICMNGSGNNMNMEDAYRFTKKISPGVVIPVHWGMFEKNDVNPSDFAKLFENSEIKAVIPEVYQKISLE